MAVRITSVAKQLPQYTRETKDILPFVELWLEGQEERFKRKVLKIFENAAVDRRYSIMDAEEVFLRTSFEEKNDIYTRECIKIAEQDSTNLSSMLSVGEKLQKTEKKLLAQRQSKI